MYVTMNNRAMINGSSGVYDGKIDNSSVRYGRNAANNNEQYLLGYTTTSEAEYPDLSDLYSLSESEFNEKMAQLEGAMQSTDKWLNELPPTDFELQYMPEEDEFDAMALMGMAYEEMGQRTEMSTDEFSETLQEAFGDVASAEALDLNSDGKIDLGEYSTSILLSDIFSTDLQNPSFSGVNGKITNEGQNATIPYMNINNLEIAQKTFDTVYDIYGLDEAQKEFCSDSNNFFIQ